MTDFVNIPLARVQNPDEPLLVKMTELFANSLGENAVSRNSLRLAAEDEQQHLIVADPKRVLAAAHACVLDSDLGYYKPFGVDAMKRFEGKKLGSVVLSAVRPDFRRRGLGKAMANEQLRWLKECRVDLVVTVSWISGGPNPSLPMFRSLGFQEIARVPEFYKNDSQQFGLICPTCGTVCHCAGALCVLDLNI